MRFKLMRFKLIDTFRGFRYICSRNANSTVCFHSEARTLVRAFAFLDPVTIMTYIAYLDEFGHVGPFVSRQHPQHKTSPVFGLAGILLPLDEVRGFATWFFQKKNHLLEFEITRDGEHPALWEKKGSSLYTVQNIKRYRDLRQFTNRFLNKISAVNGHVFYVGIKKTASVQNHNPKKLYRGVLSEAIKRLDDFCSRDCNPRSNFILALDEHDQRSALITQASLDMFGGSPPRRNLIEPPFQLESHRYQTIQAADWIAALIGRVGAYRVDPVSYSEYVVFKKYFEQRLANVSVRSGIRRR